ncbi:bacteriohemerythrin [Paramagnetospirillum kuznetsovii]|nr:bacteriohemerythrin [Paramagnetospirillum kuznetsovii]
MPIVWRDQMNVGIPEIDADHRHLISIANEFEGAVRRGAGQADELSIRSTLRQMQHYARDHFAREERMQEKMGYDGLAENKIQHAMLLRSLNDFIVLFSDGRLGPPAEATEKMTAFLNRWLVDHILKIDLKMKGKITP